MDLSVHNVKCDACGWESDIYVYYRHKVDNDEVTAATNICDGWLVKLKSGWCYLWKYNQWILLPPIKALQKVCDQSHWLFDKTLGW